MRIYQISAVLLVLLVSTAKALPLDTQTSDEIKDLESLISEEESESSQQRTKEVLFSDELPSDSNDSRIDEDEDEEQIKEDEEDNLSEDEIRIVKRSPDIPDPEVPNEHPSYDEYQEWKSRQSRYRRQADEDEGEETIISNLDEDDHDSDNDNDNSDSDDQDDLKSFDNTLREQNILPESRDENSLEDYAQGCEFDSKEMNEVTYDGFRRRRRSAEDIDGVDNDSADIDEENSRAASSDESSEEEETINERNDDDNDNDDVDILVPSAEEETNLSHDSDESV